MGIWIIFCVLKQSHHFLQTFHPLRIFKIVLRDSSLYANQLSLFFSAIADQRKFRQNVGLENMNMTTISDVTNNLHHIQMTPYATVWTQERNVSA